MSTTQLNRTQKKFCKIPSNRNVRLLAPAGSGKTFSLLWRCKFLSDQCSEKGLPAPHFLIVAFTRSAKAELEVRLDNEEFDGVHATVRTLNAWGWDQIRKNDKELITKRSQKINVITHDLLPLCNKFDYLSESLKSTYARNNNAVTILELIDLLKSLGFTHYMSKADYNAQVRYLNSIGLQHSLEEGYEKLYRIEGLQREDSRTKASAVSEFFQFWKKAVKQLEEENRYTLEDQKYWARIYLEKQINDKKSPQGITRYTHIMVDEFQDINPLDMALLKAAYIYHSAGKSKAALTIIGDDDQAIFGWRGTSPQFILHPDQYFDLKFETCVLDTNYRSPKNIVEISSRLLSYNKDREPKEMKSAVRGKAAIKVVSKRNAIAAIDATMKLIADLIEKKGCEKVALIGRRQVTLFPYQVLLSEQGTPYHVDSDIDIFEGEAMQSLLNIIQIVYRAKDEDVDDPTDAVIAICDKIDRYKLDKKQRGVLQRYLEQKGGDTFDEALEALRNYPDPIKKYTGEQVYKIISKLTASKTVYEMMRTIESELKGLEKDYNKKDTDVHYKEPQFFRLTALSKRYDADFKRFYRDIDKAKRAGERSRTRTQDDGREGYLETNNIKIHLVTATRAKGHEYDAVIVLDVNDQEWPNHLSNDIEEERRLFYVALSRARKYLYFMTSADCLESRFLLEAGLI